MKVLVTDKIDRAGLKSLESHSGIDLRYELKLSPEKLEKALKGVEAWLVRSETKVTSDWIAKAGDLRLIGRAGVGVDNIDVEAATKRGIAVINSPSANTIAACEHTCGLMLALSRNIPQADADVKNGGWNRSKWMGSELQGKTLGVVGLGRIGREVAKRARAFGMRVVGFDPFISKLQADAIAVELSDLKNLLEVSDMVTLHAPVTDKTRGLINKESITWMKIGARLINCARGELIDEAALAEAVGSGRLLGAALDVYSSEPLPADSPLRGLDRVILTPHLGASTQEAQGKVASELALGVIEFFEKGIAVNALNLPGFDADTLRSLGGFLELADSLGRFTAQMIDSGLKELHCVFQGEFDSRQLRPLSVAVTKGCFSAMLSRSLSYINAPSIAAERGVKTSVTADPLPLQGYKNLLTVTAVTDNGPTSVSGTLLAPGEPRIVRLNNLSVEVKPWGKMIVLINKDRPGVIGRVGVLLGENGVNIADMRVGRLSAHGEAVMALTVDDMVNPSVRKKLEKIEGIKDVRWVEL